MAVSRARSVKRSRLGWFSYPLPAALVAWLSNDVPPCRGLAVAWLIRGARAPREFPGIRRARHGLYRRSKDREEDVSHGGGDDRDRPAQGLAYRGGDRPGGGAAGPVAGP